MVEFVEYIDDLVDCLSFDELKDFMYVYDKYVQNFFEEHDEGCIPVSMLEYYNNDYQIEE